MWVKQDSDDFKGRGCKLFVKSDLRFICNSYLGCPVNGKSCNISSSDPEGNNILVIENAYTPTECAGTGVKIKEEYCCKCLTFFQGCVKRSLPMRLM